MARRQIPKPPPPPPLGKIWDNKLGWIPMGKKVYAARYRLAFQAVPSWREDPTYDLAALVKARKADAAKRKIATAKRKATIAARKVARAQQGATNDPL
jgi:hypothetical protein